MSRKPHEPTDATRQLVSLHSAIGTPQEDIATVLDIDAKTLRKHYREELDKGALRANARVGKTLFDKAVSGDTTAAIWWTKTRMGWKDVSRVEGTGPNGEHLGRLVIEWDE